MDKNYYSMILKQRDFIKIVDLTVIFQDLKLIYHITVPPTDHINMRFTKFRPLLKFQEINNTVHM
jgi:hypothetical protein